MTLHKLDFEEVKNFSGDGSNLKDSYFDMIKDVEVELTATVGQAKLSLSELFALEKNSVVKLEQTVDELIDISLNGQVIGKGELVASGDHFAIRILEINNQQKP